MEARQDRDSIDLVARLSKLDAEIDAIKERNARVESDKGWETSRARIAFLLGVTYVTTAIVFYLVGVGNFALTALIPTVAYYVSTLTLPFLRQRWLANRGDLGQE